MVLFLCDNVLCLLKIFMFSPYIYDIVTPSIQIDSSINVLLLLTIQVLLLVLLLLSIIFINKASNISFHFTQVGFLVYSHLKIIMVLLSWYIVCRFCILYRNVRLFHAYKTGHTELEKDGYYRFICMETDSSM